VDCSHANSGKDHHRQSAVAHDLAHQVATGSREIIGIMMESFLVEGRQNVKPGKKLLYGQSITDACMDWEATAPLLVELAAAVRKRRKAV
jgi:3-deoxy-7-phosphoheptulonate synthase